LKGGVVKGKVRRIIRERGFGFIIAENGDEVFFHRSALKEGDFDSLNVGMDVDFQVERGRRGLRAINMRLSKEE